MGEIPKEGYAEFIQNSEFFGISYQIFVRIQIFFLDSKVTPLIVSKDSGYVLSIKSLEEEEKSCQAT